MSDKAIDEYYDLYFLTNRLYERYAKTIGESTQVVYIMRLLLQNAEGICQRDLCLSLAIPKASMSRILSNLEDRGIVTLVPSTEDRREKLCQLTDSGTAFAREVTGALETIEKACVKKLRKGDVERVNRINRIYLEAFEQELMKMEEAR